MARFESFSEEITIGNEKFVITPLGGNYIGLFASLGDNREKAISDIVFASLKKADNTITREDFENIPMGELLPLVEVVIRLNKLDKK